jgi:molecular chaperone DnaJ
VEAYETLSDPERRRVYDVSGALPAEPESSTFGFEGFDFSLSVGGASAPTFGDLFADVLQPRDGRREERSAERGADLHQTVTLTLEETMHDTQREITLTRLERCRTCRGSGWVPSAERRCGHCQGIGVVKSVRGHMVFSKPCAHCGGGGREAEARCPACAGQETEMRTDVFAVKLPAGLADGARIRVPGKGHAGRHAGDHGDLYLNVRVEAHPLFKREGDDLHLALPIGIHEAALGAKIDVPSIDGPARLRVPPGTQSGQRLRVRERGVPSLRGGRRGDLVVEVRLTLPRLLDERSKELLREFGRLNNADVRSDLVKP